MTLWTLCPECNEPMEVESTHNGVMPVLHGVHCGWGHSYFSIDDCHDTPEAAVAARDSAAALNASPGETP